MEMGFESLDGRDDDEDNDVGFVEILTRSASQDAFFFGTVSN